MSEQEPVPCGLCHVAPSRAGGQVGCLTFHCVAQRFRYVPIGEWNAIMNDITEHMRGVFEAGILYRDYFMPTKMIDFYWQEHLARERKLKAGDSKAADPAHIKGRGE